MDEKKLEEMYKVTMENHQMLKAMRRSAFIGGIVKAVWWILILIVLPYFTWLYIQPYLDNIMSQYQNIQGTATQYSNDANQLKTAVSGGVDWGKLYQEYFGGNTPPNQ